MNITLFGATGGLGSQCLEQALEAGHTVTVLVRTPEKLPSNLDGKVSVVRGDVLSQSDIDQVVSADTDAVVFAIGVDKNSPEHLCATATELIFKAMRARGIKRFVWCGGGSTFVPEDEITLGAKFVRKFAEWFMSLRHEDKEQQYKYLQEATDIDWLGVRPCQMGKGKLTGSYRLGFDPFNGMSKISFADCAHAMIDMLEDDTWMHKAPIVQY